MRTSSLIVLKIFFFCSFALASRCFAEEKRVLQGYNWYSEKLKQEKSQQSKTPQEKISDEKNALPDYEKNIRKLKKRLEAAHRRSLDNPTDENILAELYLEKKMMQKAKLYAERRVAIAKFAPDLLSLDEHSNVLHRSVRQQKESKKNHEKLTRLSKDWGLILQVDNECPHCHVFAPIVLEFANQYGFEVLAASIDGLDFENIEGVVDAGQMQAFNPNRETPILYLLKNDGSEVLPISRGINSADQIINNIKDIDQYIKRLF
jgi:conjugal transfer pilus assembly protein TraF